MTIQIVCAHLHEFESNLSNEDKELLKIYETVAKEFCIDYTGDDTILENEAVTVVVLSLIADMWDRRSYSETGVTIVNPIAKSILGMYSKNLIPTEV